MPKRSAMRMLIATVTVLTSACLSVTAANAEPAAPEKEAQAVNRVIPKPASVVDKEAAPFQFSKDDCVSLSSSGASYAADILRKDVKVPFGVALPVGEKCRVTISVDDASQPVEGYTLDVSKDAVKISAAGSPGAIWGVQTLAQLIGPATGSPVTLAMTARVPAVTVTDKPGYSYRGLLVDPARNFLTRDEIFSIIDHMSQLKLNRLHMHLSDDQGWRLEIAQPPKADNPDGIDYSDLVKYSGDTAFLAGDSKFAPSAAKGGYYTEQDYEAIVAYAAKHGIQVVPEFDSPAHAGAILHAISQLNSGPKTDAFPYETAPRPNKDTGRIDQSDYKTTTTLVPNEVTFRFLSTVFTTVLGYQKKAVPADSGIAYDRIHLGGDENTKLGDEGFVRFIKGLSSLPVAGQPAKTFWEEAMKAGADVADGQTMQIWRKATNKQLPDFMASHPNTKYIISKAPVTYYPQRPTAQVAGPGWACSEKDSDGAKFCSLKGFYEWDPASFVGDDNDKVLGVEGAMWNEHVRSLHSWEFSVYPRLASTAEVAWTPTASRDFASFAQAIPNLGQHLIFDGATFHIDPMIAPEKWTGGLYPVDRKVVKDGTLALVVYPGLTNSDEVKATATMRTADDKVVDVPVKVTMATAFHLSDADHTTGRQMNSIAKIACVDPAQCAVKGASFVVKVSVPSSNDAVAPLSDEVMLKAEKTSPTDQSSSTSSTNDGGTGLSSKDDDQSFSDGSQGGSSIGSTNGSQDSSSTGSASPVMVALIPVIAAIVLAWRSEQAQAFLAPIMALFHRK